MAVTIRKTLLVSAVTFALLWWFVTNGALAAWVVGVPCIALIVFLQYRGKTTSSAITAIYWTRLPGFIVFFIYQSIRGGLDTASRVVSRQLNIQPQFFKYKYKYSHTPMSESLFVNLVSLLPGSVCALRETDSITLHLLSDNPNIEDELAQCEIQVLKLLKQIKPTGGDHD